MLIVAPVWNQNSGWRLSVRVHPNQGWYPFVKKRALKSKISRTFFTFSVAFYFSKNKTGIHHPFYYVLYSNQSELKHTTLVRTALATLIFSEKISWTRLRNEKMAAKKPLINISWWVAISIPQGKWAFSSQIVQEKPSSLELISLYYPGASSLKRKNWFYSD